MPVQVLPWLSVQELAALPEQEPAGLWMLGSLRVWQHPGRGAGRAQDRESMGVVNDELVSEGLVAVTGSDGRDLLLPTVRI